MKAYDDENCECYKIEAEIRTEFPNANWNVDEACHAWRDRNADLPDNSIEFEAYSDENYGCTCPTCGRMICGWCV